MKYAVRQMMKQDPLSSGERGWIVNVASIGGLVGLAQERKLNLCLKFLLQISSGLTVNSFLLREQGSSGQPNSTSCG